MAFLDFHFSSDALGLSCAAYVLLPQPSKSQIGIASGQKREKYQTLYLLHGLSDDHTIWLRRTSIERYAAAKNIAVVMPAVARSFYQDMVTGPKYWTFVSEELPALCQSLFPLSPDRDDNFAAGLSMGGYGALRMALGRPDKFSAAASLSGAVDIVKRAESALHGDSPLRKVEFEGIFGDQLTKLAGGEADLKNLAHKVISSAGPAPKLWFCCGTEDGLVAENRGYRDFLDGIHYEHRYEEGPGQHEWGYWDANIQKVLDWLPLKE